MFLNGSLLFAKYAFSPNKLKYCGPDDNRAIFDYCVAQQSDRGLVQLLEKFEGAYPYLEFIAKENKIKDPFDYRVVEAYWLGNELLDNINMDHFYSSLKDRFKKRNSKATKWLFTKPILGAKPNHAFHVFDVYVKLGSMRGEVPKNVIQVINSCMISWGRIVKFSIFNPSTSSGQVFQFSNKSQIPNSKNSNKIMIEYTPIVLKKGKLVFGAPVKKEIQWRYEGKAFIKKPQIGDWVSVHWDWACDVLDQRQLANLQRWTQYHLNLANLTL